jgi:hypothetical protein
MTAHDIIGLALFAAMAIVPIVGGLIYITVNERRKARAQLSAQEIRMQLMHGRPSRRQAGKLMQRLAILTDRSQELGGN